MSATDWDKISENHVSSNSFSNHIKIFEDSILSEERLTLKIDKTSELEFCPRNWDGK